MFTHRRASRSMLAMAIAVFALAISGCSKKEEVSFQTTESNRATALNNAKYNASKYRAEAVQYSNYAIEVQGDSTQSAVCPQGDGWASAKLVNKDNPAQQVALKCSTVSSTIGCMRSDEFATKPYASDDKACQAVSKVPFPIPKIGD